MNLGSVNKKKSVLLLTTSFPLDETSSAGIFILNECRTLSKYFNIKLICPHHYRAPREEQKEGIEIVRFKYFLPSSLQKVAYGAGIPTNLKKSNIAKFQFPFFLLFFMWASMRRIRKGDKIYAHWFIAGLIGVLLKKIYGNQLILMMHHAHSPNPIFRWILKNCDFVFANSNFAKKRTLEIYPNIPIEAIGVPIANQFVHPVSTETADSLKNTLGYVESDFILICIGRFIELKGQKYLIEAMSQIATINENIKLLLVGDGPSKAMISGMIEKLNLSQIVTCIESVPNEELPNYFHLASACVMPSIIDEMGDTEGLGMTALGIDGMRSSSNCFRSGRNSR